jgi:hypothetical protein
MPLDQMMRQDLPLNRKERYYTGTVFPMLVCRDNFRHFPRLCVLIEGCPPLEVDGRPETTNIQFFTEYSFAESVFGSSRARFPAAPTSRDTPDIVMLISGVQRVLIAIEAKMFDVTTRLDLLMQMGRQEQILKYIRGTLEIDTVVHCALLPAKLKAQISELPYPILTWEELYAAFYEVAPEDYFLGVLGYALESYDELVGVANPWGKNREEKLRGIEIYNAFKVGSLRFTLMGRRGGPWGERLEADIGSGRWRLQEYELTTVESRPNRNWFTVEEFVRRIDGGARAPTGG